MDHEKINSVLRTLVAELLKTGEYKKRDICVATFGGGSSPQFEHFIKGVDVGIKPLRRIFESFGYELAIVPVPKNSKEARTEKSIETLDEEFINDSRKSLTEYLDNLESEYDTRGRVTKVFEDTANDLLQQIIKS